MENGNICPDAGRLQPLKKLPSPHDSKSLKRVLGLFSHYSQWIPKFSDKVAPLLKSKTFPLDEAAEKRIPKVETCYRKLSCRVNRRISAI